jgi:cysteine desulfurase
MTRPAATAPARDPANREAPVYLDYNATTPVDPAVRERIETVLAEHFGNPSSDHAYGRRAREVIDVARAQLAALIGARDDEIVFTGGATEANNMAILGVARALRDRGRHLVTSAVEHPSVMQVMLHLQSAGWELSVVPVDRYGRVDPDAVRRAIRPDTVLVSVMHANNEVGTVQPIAEIAAVAHASGVILHTDAAQSVAKIPVSVESLGADLLTAAGHKFYAPKGVGALYVRTGVRLEPIVYGAGQERGRRAGTENVAFIGGLGEAARLAQACLPDEGSALRDLRDLLWRRLSEAVPGLTLNGHPHLRLPNTLNVSFPGVDARVLLDALSADVAASVGSACHARGEELSGVLAAMGVPPDEAIGAVRFSVGRPTGHAAVAGAADAVVRVYAGLVKRGG